MEIKDFSKLTNRTIIKIEAMLKTPLHIGGNFDLDLESDSPMIKTKDGVPYIPGSSIKGVLRSASEKLSYLVQSDKESCYLQDGGCGQLGDNKEKISDWLEKEDEFSAYQKIYKLLCPVCRTYGGGTIASKVKVNNVYLNKDALMIRDGIRINRETGAVDTGAKYDYEYVDEGEEFTIEIEAENLTKENEKILAIALAQLRRGMLRFGGMQARGLGEISVKDGTVKEYTFTPDNNIQAISTLLGIKDSENVSVYSLDDYLQKVLVDEKENEK